MSKNQRGSALIVTLMVMALLGLFIAASLSQATTEATLMSNANTNTQSFYAAQASLELMSRNFNNLFDAVLTPSQADIDSVKSSVPSIPGFTITQDVQSLDNNTSTTAIIASGQFAGLSALRNRWSFSATATATNGSQVLLTRTINNYLVPIFQFGTFYNNDMDFHPGPLFNFGGRVHSNGNIYLAANTGLYFRDKVTAAKSIVTDIVHNGTALSTVGATIGHVYVSNGSTNVSVTQGSVTGGPSMGSAPGSQPGEPMGTSNATSWASFAPSFNGNLVANATPLRLPLTIGNNDPVELIRRGKSTDSAILASSRYYNKPGLRLRQPMMPPAHLTSFNSKGCHIYWPEKCSMSVELCIHFDPEALSDGMPLKGERINMVVNQSATPMPNGTPSTNPQTTQTKPQTHTPTPHHLHSST